ncbi:hypothetical protein [Pseudomonas rubra]|uniref:Uncharacterized protein n=1 Tax=Pseudomonas rubra TaxID=2942627 RepID=A0ABT5P7P6_9PSED|nr:hypothetical protein [Pseudomonas rubra]MDD1014324.1 hypothetical protein [Pseudomonas rubra]MDD1038053.1 hypothetical protein [Pseudomonas rubra]MDD1155486.1 hypothetical protein [Pseudomonas rubra]
MAKSESSLGEPKIGKLSSTKHILRQRQNPLTPFPEATLLLAPAAVGR